LEITTAFSKFLTGKVECFPGECCRNFQPHRTGTSPASSPGRQSRAASPLPPATRARRRGSCTAGAARHGPAPQASRPGYNLATCIHNHAATSLYDKLLPHLGTSSVQPATVGHLGWGRTAAESERAGLCSACSASVQRTTVHSPSTRGPRPRRPQRWRGPRPAPSHRGQRSRRRRASPGAAPAL
jgi:hypothetical protein